VTLQPLTRMPRNPQPSAHPPLTSLTHNKPCLCLGQLGAERVPQLSGERFTLDDFSRQVLVIRYFCRFTSKPGGQCRKWVFRKA